MRALSVLLVLLVGNPILGQAEPITQLESPCELSEPRTTIDFDEAVPGSSANSLFEDRGVLFEREDEQGIAIMNWEALGRGTTSQPNVIATISFEDAPTFVTHLNLIFNPPVHEIGAFFGNDQLSSFTNIALSVFDGDDVLIGTVRVPPNDIVDVDQFVGLRSNVPITRARFENEDTSSLSVVLDDISFAATASGLQARFSMSPEGCPAGHRVSLDARNSSAPDGTEIVAYTWELGDGATLDGARVDHEYAASATGVIEICLTVTTDTGASARCCRAFCITSEFVRANCNDDSTVDMADGVFTLSFLFLGENGPACDDACDSNDDGSLDISDAIATLTHLFHGDPAVIAPPGTMECGVDPSEDELGCDASVKCGMQ